MKNVIITGASRGIGFALVEYFIKQDHQILAISRSTEVFTELQKKYSKLSVLQAEITQEGGINSVTNFVSQQWKKVDIIIHNAGKLIHKPFLKTSIDDFMEVYKVNVFAVAELTKAMLPFLSKGSHVVAVSSMGGIQGSLKFAGLSAYSSSKGAVITLIELLAEEYKDSGISFNVLALGAVQTEMLQEAFPDYKAPITAIQMANYIGHFSLTGNEMYNGKVLQVSNSTP
ncbi:MAG: SDR family oxidoreductase [Flavobacteriaceae bacterium]|nr:SDR family oxidoreductase [Flavobacteriaceae bacterium]